MGKRFLRVRQGQKNQRVPDVAPFIGLFGTRRMNHKHIFNGHLLKGSMNEIRIALIESSRNAPQDVVLLKVPGERITMAMWIFLAVYGSASLLTKSASSLDLKERPVTKVSERSMA